MSSLSESLRVYFAQDRKQLRSLTSEEFCSNTYFKFMNNLTALGSEGQRRYSAECQMPFGRICVRMTTHRSTCRLGAEDAQSRGIRRKTGTIELSECRWKCQLIHRNDSIESAGLRQGDCRGKEIGWSREPGLLWEGRLSEGGAGSWSGQCYLLVFSVTKGEEICSAPLPYVYRRVLIGARIEYPKAAFPLPNKALHHSLGHLFFGLRADFSI